MHHLKVKLEEDVIDTCRQARSLALPQNAMRAFRTLLEAMYPVSPPNNMDFCTIAEKQEFVDGEELAACMDFVLADLR